MTPQSKGGKTKVKAPEDARHPEDQRHWKHRESREHPGNVRFRKDQRITGRPPACGAFGTSMTACPHLENNAGGRRRRAPSGSIHQRRAAKAGPAKSPCRAGTHKAGASASGKKGHQPRHGCPKNGYRADPYRDRQFRQSADTLEVCAGRRHRAGTSSHSGGQRTQAGTSPGGQLASGQNRVRQAEEKGLRYKSPMDMCITAHAGMDSPAEE